MPTSIPNNTDPLSPQLSPKLAYDRGFVENMDIEFYTDMDMEVYVDMVANNCAGGGDSEDWRPQGGRGLLHPL